MPRYNIEDLLAGIPCIKGFNPHTDGSVTPTAPVPDVTNPVAGSISLQIDSSTQITVLHTGAGDNIAVDTVQLERRVTGTSTWTVLSANATFDYIDTVSQNTSYDYRAIVTDTSANTATTAISTGATQVAAIDTTLPTAGTLSLAINSSIQITVSHTGSSDDVAIASVQLERSLTGTSGWSVLNANATFPYSDSTLTASTLYYYRAVVTDTTGNSATTPNVSATTQAAASFQLAVGNFVPAKMAPVLVHPRPDNETNTWARHRKAYPAVPYSIPIGVQGGAWPFKYELTGTVPTGMTVGSVYGDADYGVVKWPSPTTGTHTLTATVTDQVGTVTNVAWELVVGTAGHIFVDSVSGSDLNDGAIGTPFATIDAWYKTQADSTYVGYHVHYRTGTYAINSTDASVSNNVRLYSTLKPMVHIAYGNESPVFDGTNGKFIGSTNNFDDLYFGGLRLENSIATDANSQFIVGFANADRITVFDTYFFNGRQGTAHNDNESCCYLNKPSIARKYVYFGHNTYDTLAAGSNGFSAFDTYWCDYLLAENNTAINIDSGQCFWPKQGNRFVSLRNNAFPDGNALGGILLDLHQSETSGHSAGPIEACWNYVNASLSNPNQCFPLLINVSNTSATSAGAAYSYRNTLIGGKITAYFEGLGDETSEFDVIVNENNPHVSSAIITVTNSVEGNAADGIVDANGLLQGTYRTTHLGTKGHEVA